MKANELMIGYWVYSTFCDKPCKVVGVEQYESGYANVKVTNVSGVKDINSLIPIPLTPEILEKNGFEFLIDTWYLQTEERKPIHIRFMDGFIAISINCNIIPMGLKYVHQLQHALRLCGIDKTIEL